VLRGAPGELRTADARCSTISHATAIKTHGGSQTSLMRVWDPLSLAKQDLPLSTYCGGGGTTIEPLSITPALWKNSPVSVVQKIEKRFAPING
jgi:hypothetical protein